MRTTWVYAVSVVVFLSTGAALAETPDASTSTSTPPADTGAAATPTAAPAAAPAKDPVFTQEQLEQMAAPIALYPDPLLAQVLMASTYPGEVAEAVTWSKANPNAKGDDAVKQVANQPWDPSVQALVAFPQVLATLGQDPVWVQRLGDAFLAQPDDLMNSVQNLRRKAQAAGNLESNQYQNVTVQVAAPAPTPAPADRPKAETLPAAPASSSSTIIIQPADPQVVYVPTYNPTTAYGTWPYPASPPAYYPPPPAYYPGQALVAGLAFGTGVAIVASLWGDCDWNNHDVDIDVNRYNNINGNNINRNNISGNNRLTNNKWQHNPANRDGVPYRDARSREQYGRQLDGARQREAFRGDDAQRAQARDRARNSMDRAGIQRPATSNRQAQDQMRQARSEGAAGNRLQQGNERPRATDRSQNANRNIRENQQPRRETAQNNQRNLRENQQPRREAAQNNQRRQDFSQNRQGAARNNAFAGVRSPSQSNAQALRGRASQASAQRGGGARMEGRQISRPSGAGARSRGGRR